MEQGVQTEFAPKNENPVPKMANVAVTDAGPTHRGKNHITSLEDFLQKFLPSLSFGNIQIPLSEELPPTVEAITNYLINLPDSVYRKIGYARESMRECSDQEVRAIAREIEFRS